MKIAVFLSLASVALAYCEVTVRGTGRARGLFNIFAFKHKELFKLTFTDQGTRPVMQMVPTLQKIAAFHYTASDNCGECLILAQDVGSGRFTVKEGESYMYALGANDSTPGSVYVRCAPIEQQE